MLDHEGIAKTQRFPDKRSESTFWGWKVYPVFWASDLVPGGTSLRLAAKSGASESLVTQFLAFGSCDNAFRRRCDSARYSQSIGREKRVVPPMTLIVSAARGLSGSCDGQIVVAITSTNAHLLGCG